MTSKSKEQIAAKVPVAVIQAGLPESSLPQLFDAILAQSATAIAAVPGMTSEIQAALATSLADASANAYAYVYYAGVAVGATSIIASLCLKDYDKYLNGHVPRQVYKREAQSLPTEDLKAPEHLEHIITEKTAVSPV